MVICFPLSISLVFQPVKSPTWTPNLGLTTKTKIMSDPSCQLIDIVASEDPDSVTPQQARQIADQLLVELQLLVRIHARTQAQWRTMSKLANQVTVQE